MKALVAVWVLVLATLAGCGDDEPRCEPGHYETQVILFPMMVGKVIVLRPQPVETWVCD